MSQPTVQASAAPAASVPTARTAKPLRALGDISKQPVARPLASVGQPVPIAAIVAAYDIYVDGDVSNDANQDP